MERWMTLKSRRVFCVLTKQGLGITLALVFLGLTPALAATVDTEVRLRVDDYPSATSRHWGGRVRLKSSVRQEFANVRLKAEVLATASDTPWGSGNIVEIGDAHLSWISDLGTLRVGHQQIAWGRADAFRLLDTVNPQRYPDALFDDAADARLPLWMANWEAQNGEWQWQLLAGHDKRLNASDPAFPQFQPSGESNLKTGGSADFYGFKIGIRLGPIDVALHGLSGPNPQALWRPNQLGGLDPLSVRRRLLGLSGDGSLGAVVLRGELVQIETQTLDDQLQLASQRNTQALIGADWEKDSWFISPQLYWESTSPQLYSAQAKSRLFSSLLVQKKLFQDRLKLRGFWLHGFNTQENWWSLTSSYEANDHLEWRLALDHFQVDHSDSLSSFKDIDRLSLEAVLRF